MNDLGIPLVWLTVQVTAVALAGIGVTALASRRSPGAGVSAALTALAATAGLAVLACCPLPSWWAWDVPTAPTVAASPAVTVAGHSGPASTEQPNQTAESSPGGGMRVGALISVLRNLRRGSSAASVTGSPWDWPTIVAVVAGTGTALGLLQLLLGLWAISHSWRRSRALGEPDLLRLIDELRSALGVERLVSARESADLTTAATVGWRKPVLLLPPDWRAWTDEQRRAVVAHELAHVGRGDFPAWVLARLSVAVHFWHPLVRALAGRLHLQQELAADAVAARLAGGRPTYLRALAELALRSDSRARRWPAPAFLSRKGTLLRRIEMLRVTDDNVKRSASRTGRWLTIALLFALTVAGSALRGRMNEALAGPPAGEVKPAAEEVAPFDLSLVAQSDFKKASGVFAVGPAATWSDDKVAGGVYAVRLAALLKRPGTEPMLKLLNTQIDVCTASFKEGGLGIHVEDVEQVMGRVYFTGENKTGKRAVMLSLNVLRTTKDMDWVKLRDQCGPKMKQHQWKGETYVSFPVPPFLMGIVGVEGDCYLWALDARTLVLDDETFIKAQIEAKAGGTKLVSPDYAAEWDLVSAIRRRPRQPRPAVGQPEHNGRGNEESHGRPDEAGVPRRPALPERVPGGCRLRRWRRFPVRPAGVGRDAGRGRRNGPELRGAVGRGEEDGSGPREYQGCSLGQGRRGRRRLLPKVLDRTTVSRDGVVVTVHADTASGLNEFISAYVKEMVRGKQ